MEPSSNAGFFFVKRMVNESLTVYNEIIMTFIYFFREEMKFERARHQMDEVYFLQICYGFKWKNLCDGYPYDIEQIIRIRKPFVFY